VLRHFIASYITFPCRYLLICLSAYLVLERALHRIAEALGVVASGISLAQLACEVTRCTAKVKTYWNRIQEAPRGQISHSRDRLTRSDFS
jgi:multisubunit Na+/H+ antiporter MnhC subunit